MIPKALLFPKFFYLARRETIGMIRTSPCSKQKIVNMPELYREVGTK